MEQNKTKRDSKWAAMARAGTKITWVITRERGWGRIVDDKVVEQPHPPFSKRVTGGVKRPAPTITSTTSNTSTNTSAPRTTPHQPSKLAAAPRFGPTPKGSPTTMRGFVSPRPTGHNTLRAAAAVTTATTTTTTSSTPANPYDSKTSETHESKRQKVDTRVYSLEITFPDYWCTPFNKVLQVELYPRDIEYKNIERTMQRTLSDIHKERYGYSTYKIKQIIRYQHPSLWGHYYLRQQEIVTNNSASGGLELRLGKIGTGGAVYEDANEYYLFHGLNPSILTKILDHGFDERVSNLAGMFGCGIYFAEDSSKSSQYSHSTQCQQVGAIYSGQASVCTCARTCDDDRCMLICRVTLGEPWMRLEPTDKQKPLRRPPERDNGYLFDSVIGESRAHNSDACLDFREFIVYDRRQAYPEYIVHYSRSK
eukprot:TRINITY_DN8303_c2_g1_i1.p1 TRINITY_DN8303_c2_g1~~TRINITY_DN8303_c2_g1_i1.p1  ORF type:complete len:423 (+),score=50.16 TRINITY_DN8303_c2_g1_i1:194-1462(+)